MTTSWPAPARAPSPRSLTQLLLDAVRRLFSSPLYRPPMLPRAAMEVMRLCRQLDVDFLQVSRLIESDTFFAAQVLRVANSPIYGTSKITTISQALVRLGMQTMGNVCLEAAMRGRVFRAPGLDKRMDVLTRHAQRMAQAAKLVSELAGIPGGTAFAAGLLHSAGVLAAAVAISTRAIWVSTEPRDSLLLLANRHHARLGHVVCEAWNLPEVLQDSLLNHHRYDVPMTPVSASLVLAECLLEALGGPRCEELAGLAVKDRAQDSLAFELLGIDMDALLDLAPELEKRLAEA